MNVIAFGYRKQNHLFIVAVIYENQNASQSIVFFNDKRIDILLKMMTM